MAERCPDSNNRFLQVRDGPACSPAQLTLYDAPRHFDRIEVGRVRWQVDDTNPVPFQDRPCFGRVMRTQVIHENDIAIPEPRCESPVDKATTRHGSFHCLQHDRSRHSNRPRHRDVFATACGPLAFQSTADMAPTSRGRTGRGLFVERSYAISGLGGHRENRMHTTTWVRLQPLTPRRPRSAQPRPPASSIGDYDGVKCGLVALAYDLPEHLAQAAKLISPPGVMLVLRRRLLWWTPRCPRYDWRTRSATRSPTPARSRL